MLDAPRRMLTLVTHAFYVEPGVSTRSDRFPGAESIERALERYPKERLFVNLDCGFATFSNRPVSTNEIACSRLQAIRQAVEPFR
jgi:methionine synthase II (cobalamin-independent)